MGQRLGLGFVSAQQASTSSQRKSASLIGRSTSTARAPKSMRPAPVSDAACAEPRGAPASASRRKSTPALRKAWQSRSPVCHSAAASYGQG